MFVFLFWFCCICDVVLANVCLDVVCSGWQYEPQTGLCWSNVFSIDNICCYYNHFIPVHLQIEEISRRLRTGDLGIPPNPEDRFACCLLLLLLWRSSSNLTIVLTSFSTARHAKSQCKKKKKTQTKSWMQLWHYYYFDQLFFT